MTTNSTTAEDRLAKLDIHLPDAPTPFGAYVPAVQTGNLLFQSGTLATSGHTPTVTPEFTEHPKVADAASDLLRDAFGKETATVAD
jgi:enamine deaminase RidA (YjgF/YER057c/UK114 family)